jgi:hypothetical protein
VRTTLHKYVAITGGMVRRSRFSGQECCLDTEDWLQGAGWTPLGAWTQDVSMSTDSGDGQQFSV